MLGKTFHFIVPKLFILISLALAFWVGNATLKEMDRGKRIQEEITSLQMEAQKTQKENALLEEKIKYFQTDAFQAQEARDKLNYQSPNEKTVVIKSNVPDESAQKNDTTSFSARAHNLLPNYEKWWSQFFRQ